MQWQLVLSSLGTRETSYLSAIASASAALAIAKACSLGKLQECSCGHKNFLYKDSSITEKDLFPWRGCQNHILYGLSYSKDFLDPINERRKYRSIKKLVVKQNNVAGREVWHLAGNSTHLLQDSALCKCCKSSNELHLRISPHMKIIFASKPTPNKRPCGLIRRKHDCRILPYSKKPHRILAIPHYFLWLETKRQK